MKIKPLVATPGKRIRLKNFDTAYTNGFESHEHAKGKLENNKERLAKYQDLLYAEDTYALLIILQGMDAAGKDSTVKHVMSGVNPEGCQSFNFKQPSKEELDHDFIWRAYRNLPERGRIGIFNRSYYEETLVVRVHPELLLNERLSGFKHPGKKFWQQRFQSINDMERHLVRNGTVILKFFLHLSREEQRKRFLARLEDRAKNWKFSEDDVRERLRWDDYQYAYQEMLNHTSTQHAPWYIIPADHKWFEHLAVSEVIVETLKRLHLHYPTLTKQQRDRLEKAKEVLLRQG
jgi:PPK2 family polyphosphate:nucleotide phosphotransferase